jgi:hypothetical protein
MPTPPISDDVLRKTYDTWIACNRVNSLAAKRLKISDRNVRFRIVKAAERFGVSLDRTGSPTQNYSIKKEPAFSFTPVPDDDISIEELVEVRKRQFTKKKAHEEARRLIQVKVKIDGPIGILHFGDPHVDDDGTDILALEHHKKLCQTVEGLFGANVGDVSNNWVGRLARLYGEQATSAKQAWRLVEWLLKDLKLLYLIGGNHDGWSGAGDPLQWIMKQEDSLYQSSEVRLSLNFPNGASVRVNARHDFGGSSQWNPAHGPMKAVFHGVRDHIAICGHKHKSGYGVIKDPASGITCHAIQVASYKLYDRYAREKNFRDQNLSPCVVTVIDPRMPQEHPDLVKVFWDADEGVQFLRWKRKKA